MVFSLFVCGSRLTNADICAYVCMYARPQHIHTSPIDLFTWCHSVEFSNSATDLPFKDFSLQKDVHLKLLEGNNDLKLRTCSLLILLLSYLLLLLLFFPSLRTKSTAENRRGKESWTWWCSRVSKMSMAHLIVGSLSVSPTLTRRGSCSMGNWGCLGAKY